ncbi:caveolin-1 protein [Anaeramoeba ignava]|uniref:Caveolin-1 protein n=1 Tax=Anaeramoeba ignava TaxID=1746090 RepID=A0A9Q0LDA3_ANAIG|nr:caveolin-1 protein [Anaeramoeba ignava]
MKNFLYFLLLYLLIIQFTNELETNLSPNLPLNNLEILPDVSHKFYLNNLTQNTKYEIKISYSSSNPTNFKMELFTECQCYPNEKESFTCVNEKIPKNGQRKLLNAEKVIFSVNSILQIEELIDETNCCGTVNSICHPFLNVLPLYDGFSHLENYEKRLIPINIILENLDPINIPVSCYPVIITAVILAILALILTPLLAKKIQNYSIKESKKNQ